MSIEGKKYTKQTLQFEKKENMFEKKESTINKIRTPIAEHTATRFNHYTMAPYQTSAISIRPVRHNRWFPCRWKMICSEGLLAGDGV